MSHDDKSIEQRVIIDEPMIDSKTKKYGKGYSPDGGQTFIVQEGTDGRHYHQETDAGRISQLVFDSLLLKSANGKLYELTIDSEGTLQAKEKES